MKSIMHVDKAVLERERTELYRLLSIKDIDRELVMAQSRRLDELVIGCITGKSAEGLELEYSSAAIKKGEKLC